jgi:hypothetical protein
MRTTSLGALVTMITELKLEDASKDRKLGVETSKAKLEESLKLAREEADKNLERATNDYKCHNVEAFFGILPGPGSALGAFMTSSPEDQMPWKKQLDSVIPAGTVATLVMLPQQTPWLRDAVASVAPVDCEGADRGKLGTQEQEAKLLGVASEQAKKAFEDFNDLRKAGSDNLRQAIDLATQALQAEAEASNNATKK